jgi:nitroreductase
VACKFWFFLNGDFRPDQKKYAQDCNRDCSNPVTFNPKAHRFKIGHAIPTSLKIFDALPRADERETSEKITGEKNFVALGCAFRRTAADMFNDLTSLPAYLATRRSGKPRDMIAPGPDEATLDAILTLAMRTPDHGKLFPWRFVKVTDRQALAALLERAFLAANPGARAVQVEAAVAPALMAPTLVILLYARQESTKIPEWEQQLSVGAVGMNLLHAAHAHGLVASWNTGWAAYDNTVRTVLCKDDEQISGFFFIGSPGKPLEERPRPDFDAVVRTFP